ncbi:MAG: aminotransferase class IV, partial [Phycisphaerales bacterium]|nr:aminotransferase class IV [Phycisphaerales bacterium]
MPTFLNGAWVDDATVSAFDAAVQHGVGLFETMRAEGDRVIRLVEHLERLQHSARTLRLMSELHIQPLADAVVETVRRNGHERSRVRLTLTGGDLSMLGGGA